MKVLTANRLTDGETVWFAAGKGWAETIDGAEVARDAPAEERLAEIGKAAFRDNLVLDVELIDVSVVDGRIVPNRLRERIRAAGPTIHPNLGKQARSAAPQAV